ncbi:alpha/beta hydrolase [bacterium]|nr:alpha/beta hydrolase [bacterium]|tara:strand:+ start:767 stop:1621 length:855 start_codon:yes stop_codon:yes gene_type:complete
MNSSEPVTEHLTTPSGITVEFDLWGELERNAILLLHGGGQTRHSWNATAEKLTRTGRCAITMDLRGHGGSDWSSDGDYKLKDFSSDVAYLIEQLKINPALVGASLGGLVGIYLEGSYKPSSISALVLVDIVPNINVAGADRVKSFMLENSKTGFSSLSEVSEILSKYNPHRKKSSDLEGLKKNLRKRGDKWFWHWDPMFISTERDEENPDMRNPNLLNELCKKISAPMLLVRGKLSDLVTENEVEEFLKRYPHARFADVSGAGHMVVGDENDAFAKAIIEFLNQ